MPTALNRRQRDLVILGSSSTKRILGDELESVTAGASRAPQGRRLLVQVSFAIDGWVPRVGRVRPPRRPPSRRSLSRSYMIVRIILISAPTWRRIPNSLVGPGSGKTANRFVRAARLWVWMILRRGPSDSVDRFGSRGPVDGSGRYFLPISLNARLQYLFKFALFSPKQFRTRCSPTSTSGQNFSASAPH